MTEQTTEPSKPAETKRKILGYGANLKDFVTGEVVLDYLESRPELVTQRSKDGLYTLLRRGPGRISRVFWHCNEQGAVNTYHVPVTDYSANTSDLAEKICYDALDRLLTKHGVNE